MIKHVVKINNPEFTVLNRTSRFAVVNRISRYVVKQTGDNLSTVPSGILLNPDGEPLLDPDGNYIFAGDGV